jgi:uncharacterized UPF0160 family protein
MTVKTVKVGTHDGVFHADDVLACAIVRMALGGEGWEWADEPTSDSAKLAFVRTRDPRVLDDCDIVIDVGGVYDPDRGRFDHHQTGRAGARPSGVLYSAAGLVWRKYGEIVCSNKAVAEEVDRKFVAPVCATDNGQKLFNGGTPAFEKIAPTSFSSLIASLNPCWYEYPSHDGCFQSAVETAQYLLSRAIKAAEGKAKARAIVREALRADPDAAVIRLDRFVPWEEEIVESAPHALYVVFPNETGDTQMVQCVPDALGSFGKRKALPAAWSGLRDAAFCAATGVEDGVFCHPDVFICGARTREGAMRLARLAVAAG